MSTALVILSTALLALALAILLLIRLPRPSPSTDGTSTPPPSSVPASRPVSHSSFSAAYTLHPTQTDGQGRAYAGELLKLVDVVAGIACRRHSAAQCVTISLDRVIFIQPMQVGDVVHLSVSINRAWGSSMEAGVRIMKEDARTGQRSYACHAYLTFVARAPPPPPPLLPLTFSSLPLPLSLLPTRTSSSPTKKKSQPPFQVPAVQPRTVLEHKRYLLAGRRRGHRFQRRAIWDAHLSLFRSYVLAFPADPYDDNLAGEGGAGVKTLKDVEIELVAEGYVKGDQDIRVEGDMVVAEVEGFMDKVSFPLKDIEKFIASRGTGSFRRLSLPRTHSSSSDPDAPGSGGGSVAVGGGVGWENDPVVEMDKTVATSVQIVRPQHCNSQGVLFGGELMRWLEEVALLSARHISTASFSTATVDSMTFRASAHPGYIVSLRSVVVKVWESSIECYVVATAVDRAGTDVFVSDAFFSLVALDPDSRRPLRHGGHLKKVGLPEGDGRKERNAREMVGKADERREERLQDKRILMKVYS